jgi:hypothetical protein
MLPRADGDLLACEDIGSEHDSMLSLRLIVPNFHRRHGERLCRGEPPQALQLHMSPSSARRQLQNLGSDAGSLPGSQQSRGGGKWNSTRRPLPSGRNGSAFRRCSSGRQKSIWKGDPVGTWDQRFESPFLQRRSLVRTCFRPSERPTALKGHCCCRRIPRR